MLDFVMTHPLWIVLLLLGLLFFAWWMVGTRKQGAKESGRGSVDVPGSKKGLHEALSRSRAALRGRLDDLFANPVDDALLEGIEETLLMADVGVDIVGQWVERVRQLARNGHSDPEDVRQLLRDEMHSVFQDMDVGLKAPPEKPWVILVVGVNGSGKTTTVGKLATHLVGSGKRVLIGAADTYRAAAIEQLQVWAKRAGAEFVAHQQGADPGAVAYDALTAARQRGCDVVIIDTAGRLQTRQPLMEQLSKICRVMGKVVDGAPHETLLVLDGTTGQNGLSQARLFHEATPLTGAIVTKLDGTAKGGMLLTIAADMKLPIKFIGVGESAEDLRAFDPKGFVDAIM